MTFLRWFAKAIQSPIEKRLLSDPYYRLQSYNEVRVAAALGIRIDANRATVDDWLRLPGLSIHQARRLVELAQAGVQFCCIEDVAAALNLPADRLHPLTPVLQFYYYDPESLQLPSRLNPNTATVDNLMCLPGMAPTLAHTIVQQRQQQGPYRDLVDFQRRLALPSETISQWMHYLCF